VTDCGRGAAREDIYISADLEADGPIPGRHSMLSLGLAVAGVFGPGGFEARDPEADTFYRELRPISDHFDPDALRVARLDRARLVAEGEAPRRALGAAADWIRTVAGPRRPVMVAYPLGFDWMFLQWYFVAFRGESPFGHASCLDIKTLCQQRLGAVLDLTAKSRLPAELRPSRPHTHNALDDAIEQAELLARLLSRPIRAG
jgi:hypothetical protein